MPNELILLVDDEQHIIELASMYLKQEGFRVISAGDGGTALDRIAGRAVAGRAGHHVAGDRWIGCMQRIRGGSDLPMLMLTARKDDIDKIVGLELGADDYLTKPFNPRELVARVRAILRRSEPRRVAEGREAERRPAICTSTPRGASPRRERLVDLRAKEFDLLLALVENEGIVLSREKLLDMVWGFDFAGQTRTVDVHVAHVRNKLGAARREIETVWGVGYKLSVPA